jgi:cytochrome c oxidase subunit III
MTAATATLDHHGAHPEDDHQLERTARFGMLAFLCSEAMLFTGLIATYVVLRLSQATPWIPDGNAHLPWLLTTYNTILLVASSFTFHFAEVALKKSKNPSWWLLATILLGGAFVVIQGFEWTHLLHEGAWFNTGLHYTSCFFVLTGFHGFHVFIGVLLLTVTWIRTLLGHFTAEKHAFFGNVGLYWHFVDVVWVLLFAIVYFDFAWIFLAWLTKMIMG